MARVALITGASRGIGAATALVLAKHGYRVVVNDRAGGPQAEEAVATIVAAGGEAVAIKADVTVPNDVTAMVAEIDRRWGGTDVLVHNAPTPSSITSFAELRWEQLGGKLDSELRAAFLTTKAVVPGMISRGYGRLIYLSTVLSRHPREGMITLGAAKAALDQFVRYVALELAPHGITANLVAPATVEGTRVTRQLTAERLHAKRPAGRFGRAAEVAELLSYNLAHPDEPRMPPAPRGRRKYRIAGMAVLAVLLLAGGMRVIHLPSWAHWATSGDSHAAPRATLTGHTGPVWSVAFARTG